MYLDTQRLGTNNYILFQVNIGASVDYFRSHGFDKHYRYLFQCKQVKVKRCFVFCILTIKRVLRTPFAGQNQFFDTKTTFYVRFSHKKYKMTQHITQNVF